jgi:GT2 family glycosyltransferase
MQIEMSRPTVVAIPARNEEARIEACLAALAVQTDPQGARLAPGRFAVYLLVNNSQDATLDRARRFARHAGLKLHVRSISLPQALAHAGEARGRVMDWAGSALGSDVGVICTTDADSRVAPDWLWRIWAAVERGADAVAGVIAFDPSEAGCLQMPELRRLEGRYASLQAEVDARHDPDPINPWPNHIWAWGASLAVTAKAYRAVGGVPRVSLAEDRALVAALKAGGHRVRHAPDVMVFTSCRRQGRAPGGLADLIATYESGDLDRPCDAALEPILLVQRRATLRRALRAAYTTHNRPSRRLLEQLKLPAGQLSKALSQSTFGAAWALIERDSPPLQPRRLRPGELPLEMARAEAILRQIRRERAKDPSDTSAHASAGPW